MWFKILFGKILLTVVRRAGFGDMFRFVNISLVWSWVGFLAPLFRIIPSIIGFYSAFVLCIFLCYYHVKPHVTPTDPPGWFCIGDPPNSARLLRLDIILNYIYLYHMSKIKHFDIVKTNMKEQREIREIKMFPQEMRISRNFFHFRVFWLIWINEIYTFFLLKNVVLFKLWLANNAADDAGQCKLKNDNTFHIIIEIEVWWVPLWIGRATFFNGILIEITFRCIELNFLELHIIFFTCT